MCPRSLSTRVPGLPGHFARHRTTSTSSYGHPRHHSSDHGQGVAKIFGNGRLLPEIHTEGSNPPLPPFRGFEGQAKGVGLDPRMPIFFRGNKGSPREGNIAFPSQAGSATSSDHGRIKHGSRRRPRAAWTAWLGTISVLFVQTPSQPASLASLRQGVIRRVQGHSPLPRID